MINILTVFMALSFLLSGCVVNNQPDIAEHGAHQVYDRVHNSESDQRINSLRSSIVNQMARRTIEKPISNVQPIANAPVYLPVTILPRLMRGGSAGRDRTVEYRLHTEGGLILQ